MIVIALGRRKADQGLIIDYKRGRVLARVTTANIPDDQKIKLDEIPPGKSGMFPAIILSKVSWGDKVCVAVEREGWGIHDYFMHASRRLGAMGVKL